MESKYLKISIICCFIAAAGFYFYKKIIIPQKKLEAVLKNVQSNDEKRLLVKNGIINKYQQKIMSDSDNLKILLKCINLNGIDQKKLKTDIYTTAEKIYRAKDYKCIAELINPEIIAYCNNLNLFQITFNSYLKTKTKDSSIELCENICSKENISDLLKISCENKLKQMYIDKIKILIKNKRFEDALNIYNILSSKAEDDPEVLLLGAEILVFMEDSTGAEYLLDEIKTPGKYARHISDLKKKIQEINNYDKQKHIMLGDNAVPFSKEGSNICINGIVNDYMEQQFILDTGASMTSIPPDSLEQLGIKVPFDAPIKKISTAGGIIFAREIEIKSLQIGRFKVNNIKILDLQLPGQPEKGLLGMNFLKKFHMEVNQNENVLILSEK